MKMEDAIFKEYLVENGYDVCAYFFPRVLLFESCHRMLILGPLS